MKIITTLLLAFMVFNATAQNITYHNDDTLRTVDPDNPNKQYISVYNFKGNITAQGTLMNGKRDGLWRIYANGNGQLSQIGEFKNGELSGASIMFGTNGMVLTDETYKNNKLSGTRTLMNNMGRIKSVENYSDGILNGPKKTFYEDGKIQEDGAWTNGQRDGVTRWYNSKGNISLQHTYINGVLQGEAREYNDLGQIQRFGNYEKNNEQGEWKEFAPDSILVKRTIYDKGKVVKEIPVKSK